MTHPACVTDTNALLFHAGGRRGKLGKRAAAHLQACEKQAALTFVPAALIWEASLLNCKGRVDFAMGVRGFFETLFTNPAYQPVDLTPEQIYLAQERRISEDPFDSLICAAALHLGLPLITADMAIQDSGLVKVVWE